MSHLSPDHRSGKKTLSEEHRRKPQRRRKRQLAVVLPRKKTGKKSQFHVAGFRPVSGRPRQEDERAVGYVKGNALAGRSFASWAELEGHPVRWMREVADVRIHAGTGERPIDRFAREAGALRPLRDRPPFRAGRALIRKVHSDACVELDGNRYSVPWRSIGCEVAVEVQQGTVRILHDAREIARHPERSGRGHRSIDPAHLEGIVATRTEASAPPVAPDLLRPLREYQEAAGGDW